MYRHPFVFPNTRLQLEALTFGDTSAVSCLGVAVICLGGVSGLAVLQRSCCPLLAMIVNTDLAAMAVMRPERLRLIFGIFLAALIEIVDVRRIVAFLMIPDVIVRRLASSLQGMATGTVPMNPAAVARGPFASAQFDKPYGLSIMVAALPPVRSVACIGPIHYRVAIQRNRRGC